MRMEQLRCLADIALTHSITNTAQRLFMTQQAVSSRIKQLEQDLGIELLIRTNTGVQLTRIGEEVADYARQILDTERAIGALCEARKQQLNAETVTVRVCSTSSVANIVFPDIFYEASINHQKLSMKIILTDNMDELLQQVKDNECDIGFFTYNEKELREKFISLQGELKLDILAWDELVAVTDRRLVKEGQTEIVIDKHGSENIITMFNLLPSEEYQEKSFNDTLVSSNNADFHRRMIEKVGAIVIMPRLAYQYFFNAKKYIGLPLADKHVTLVHAAVYREDTKMHLQDMAAVVRQKLYKLE